MLTSRPSHETVVALLEAEKRKYQRLISLSPPLPADVAPDHPVEWFDAPIVVSYDCPATDHFTLNELLAMAAARRRPKLKIVPAAA